MHIVRLWEKGIPYKIRQIYRKSQKNLQHFNEEKWIDKENRCFYNKHKINQ